MREGLYADLYAEKEARAANERLRNQAANKEGGGVGKTLKGIFGKGGKAMGQAARGLMKRSGSPRVARPPS